MEYYCTVCNYTTLFSKVFNKHLTTQKHISRSDEEFVIKKRYTGYYKFVCKECDYKSNLKTHYQRHLVSNIHNLITTGSKTRKSSGPMKETIHMSSLFLD